MASIVKKTNNRLKFLYRHRNALNFKTRKLLANALIFSHFDYAMVAWYPILSKTLKEKLQIAQNKVVRFVLELGPRSHIGQNELDRIGVLKVSDRAKQLTLHQMFHIYYRTAPKYLLDLFRRNSNPYTRTNQNNFAIPRSNGSTKPFSVTGAMEWNNLSVTTNCIANFQQF